MVRKLVLVLIIGTIISGFMIRYRVSQTGTSTYMWLLYPNLVLVWIPFLTALVMRWLASVLLLQEMIADHVCHLLCVQRLAKIKRLPTPRQPHYSYTYTNTPVIKVVVSSLKSTSNTS